MKFNPDTLASVQEQMALRQSSIHRALFDELLPPGNGGTTDSHRRNGSERFAGQWRTRFLPALFFTNDLADLEQILRDAAMQAMVAGYLTKAANKNIAAAFQQSGFNPIATYRRMIT